MIPRLTVIEGGGGAASHAPSPPPPEAVPGIVPWRLAAAALLFLPGLTLLIAAASVAAPALALVYAAGCVVEAPRRGRAVRR